MNHPGKTLSELNSKSKDFSIAITQPTKGYFIRNPPPKKGGLVVILAIVAVVLAVGILGGCYMYNQKVKKEVKEKSDAFEKTNEMEAKTEDLNFAEKKEDMNVLEK